MRPARKGPENGRRRVRARVRRGRFNEAGPQGAGKRLRDGPAADRDRASMRPARKGPENGVALADRRERRLASMRPARKGPENAAGPPGPGGRPPRFNEAGPQGAGKPAGAALGRPAAAASMRPARKGPENVEDVAGDYALDGLQ